MRVRVCRDAFARDNGGPAPRDAQQRRYLQCFACNTNTTTYPFKVIYNGMKAVGNTHCVTNSDILSALRTGVVTDSDTDSLKVFTDMVRISCLQPVSLDCFGTADILMHPHRQATASPATNTCHRIRAPLDCSMLSKCVLTLGCAECIGLDRSIDVLGLAPHGVP